VDEARQIGPRVQNGSVFTGDVVATGPGATATMVFSDSSVVKLKEKTTLSGAPGRLRQADGRGPGGEAARPGDPDHHRRHLDPHRPNATVATEFETRAGSPPSRGTTLTISVSGEALIRHSGGGAPPGRPDRVTASTDRGVTGPAAQRERHAPTGSNGRRTPRLCRLGMPMATSFKTCSCCGQVWGTRDAFMADPGTELIGYQAFFEALELGLFLFNHAHCGTTMALQAEAFTDLHTGPVFSERLTGERACVGYCLQRNELDRAPTPASARGCATCCRLSEAGRRTARRSLRRRPLRSGER